MKNGNKTEENENFTKFHVRIQNEKEMVEHFEYIDYSRFSGIELIKCSEKNSGDE